MGVLNQRDPDEVQQIARTRDDLDELTRTVTARWGRVPIVGADPTSPPDGSVWIRSDDGGVRVRSGGVTRPIPFGFVGSVTSSVDIAGITTTETDIINGNVNLIVGRRYEMTLRTHVSLTVATDTFFLRGYIDGTNVLFHVPMNVTTAQVWTLPSIDFVATTSGSRVVKATLQRSAGTGSASALGASFIAGKIIVKDIGV